MRYGFCGNRFGKIEDRLRDWVGAKCLRLKSPQIQANGVAGDCNPWRVFLIFLRLGLTSFGGPIAHLGYFRDEFVTRRQWLSERRYADLVALCQFLPGPASSQVGIVLGFSRSGYLGALAAWMGFTLPSAILMILFALGISVYRDALSSGVLHGLKVVAVAVVAQAVWGMARNLCTDVPKVSLMAISTCVVLFFPSVFAQLATITFAGFVGMLVFSPAQESIEDRLPVKLSKRTATLWLMLFFGLLIGLPIWAQSVPGPSIAMVDAFFRAGSWVFGGGHLVLPMLQTEVVTTGWVSGEGFLAGYGAAQAVPGPLFTFAGFLGASMNSAPTGWGGGIIGLLAIFAPSFLLVFGVLPFWEDLRQSRKTQAALAGINAAVVGILLAALYQPVWTSAIHRPQDFGLALLAWIALMFWKLPPWLVVLSCGFAGWIFSIFV